MDLYFPEGLFHTCVICTFCFCSFASQFWKALFVQTIDAIQSTKLLKLTKYLRGKNAATADPVLISANTNGWLVIITFYQNQWTRKDKSGDDEITSLLFTFLSLCTDGKKCWLKLEQLKLWRFLKNDIEYKSETISQTVETTIGTLSALLPLLWSKRKLQLHRTRTPSWPTG